MLNTGCRWRDLPRSSAPGPGTPPGVDCVRGKPPGVGARLHQLVLDELSEADVLDWSRASIDAVSVRAKRGAS